ncbi:MAG: helicase C-terminal domain-containing protein [Planctomycetota bacterium]|jgi:DNA excision repair protein ERCC-2
MTIRVDIDQKKLSCSVRDLAGEEEKGSIMGGMMLRGRAKIGQDIHASYQESQAEDKEYRREVHVEKSFDVGDWSVTISGRIDGIYEEDGKTIVEEIKSVVLAPEDFADIKIKQYPAYRRQLEFYLYFLSEEMKQPPVGRLVFINHPDAEVRDFEIEPDIAVVGRAVKRSARRLVDEAVREQETWRARREAVGKVVFPYETVREWQDIMIERATAVCEEGGGILVSAPAGIGKTVASLYSALRAAYASDRRVFFATSKRTQQALVAETLEAMREKGAPVTSVTLTAKERMCSTGEVFCHPEVCEYARNFYGRLAASTVVEDLLAERIILADAIRKRSEAELLCPFEVSLELTNTVDVIIGDYNYVFDPIVALSRFFDEDDYDHLICIIDEAHNLHSRGRDYYSPALSRAHCRELAAALSDELAGDPYGLGGFIDRLEDLSGRRVQPGRQSSLPQQFIKWLKKLDDMFAEVRLNCADAEIRHPSDHEVVIDLDPEPFSKMRRHLDMLVLEHLMEKRLNRIVEKEDPVLDFYFAFTRFERVLNLKGPEFAYIARVGDDEHYDVLRILCKDPSGQLAQRISGFHASVGMSATLAPMDYYRDVLGFPSGAELLDLPSPFPPENRKVIIVPSVDTTYRKRESYAPDIADIISLSAAVRPGNYFAFFPSFAYMRSVAEHIRVPDFRIETQEREMDDRARRKFLKRLGGGTNHLMLGVQGGIFAEGVDYPGEMLVGVFIVSPALPRYGLDTELMKAYYDETREKGFEYAYIYPGMNRVIQAAGRVHRSHEDRGFIMLLGRRFAGGRYGECLPNYWYFESPRELISSDPVRTVSEFWSTGE